MYRKIAYFTALFALLLTPTVVLAERHVVAFPGSACVPTGSSGYTNIEYWNEGAVLNNDTSSARKFICPVGNFFEGSSSSVDWYITGTISTAGVDVDDNSSGDPRCQAFRRTRGGESWSWTSWNSASSEGMSTIGVESPTFAQTDSVGIVCELPSKSGASASQLLGYYTDYQDWAVCAHRRTVV